jgi:bacteriophage N4 adsorption protein B
VWIDRWVAACLLPLAAWILISSLDDLLLAAAFLYRVVRRSAKRPAPAPGPPRPIALFLPLWREHAVVEKMIGHNLGAIRYPNFDLFVGVYPNDAETQAAVRAVERRFPTVHMALCPHDGPTSKADCLNWIYQRMLLFEEEHGLHFEIVVTHDAEDLIHPDSLEWINRYIGAYDMVQVPVLPLPTPFHKWTHGIYCDEFAEFQIKDVPMRGAWGSFLPSNGVGTGYSRAVLETLANVHTNRVFDPASLTEDYENGFRIHALGRPQIFIPIKRQAGELMATREYFPHSFRSAVRQRARWVTGIALQSWENHGWNAPLPDIYWFWRDRKGLIGNLVTPLANLIFLYGTATWAYSHASGRPWVFGTAAGASMEWICALTFALSLVHGTIRTGCVARIYGLRFAFGVPLRALWGNCINFSATVIALKRFFLSKLHHQPLVWSKTEHTYPTRAALQPHKRPLGEILVGSAYLDPDDLEAALASKPAGVRLGEHLVALGKLSEQDLYEALSLQQNMPFGRPVPDAVSRAVTRTLPAEVARKWRVLPFRVASGRLFVLGPEPPCDEATRELSRFSSLELQFHLVTPSDFEEIASQYLP